ncbi:hypothetical protein GIB67_040955 [Kingdonia uniflora]|uniref:Uncharacterized protein n=1 Tax=Kingdonia uniflora TaxID=39325 RepID=A0A7J7M6C5_9MAGN|nr:hypothetical protein GIB67_040955 [Kingdonia uniflora]
MCDSVNIQTLNHTWGRARLAYYRSFIGRLLVHPNLITHLIYYRSLIGSSQFDHPSNTLQVAYWFIPIRPLI